MSKRSNKRARKIDQEKLFEQLVQVDEQRKIAKLDNDELFYVAPSKADKLKHKKHLTLKETQRRNNLYTILFGAPQTEQTKNQKEIIYNPLKKTTKPLQSTYKVSRFRLQRNRKLRASLDAKEAAAEAERAELKAQGVQFDSYGKVVSDVADIQDGDNINSATAENFNGLTKKIDFSKFYTRPKTVIVNKNGKIYRAPKEAPKPERVIVEADADHDGYHVKPNQASIAKAVITGRHYDFMDIDRANDDEEIDIWDSETLQRNAEDKVIQTNQKKHRLHKYQQHVISEQDELEYIQSTLKNTMKNKRSKKSSINITQKALRVAPAGLSINPAKEDMELLLDVYKRRVANEQRKKYKLEKALSGDISIPIPRDVSKKDKLKMAKLYAPIPREPTLVKIKTRTERNLEKKKAKVRYEHAMLRKQKRFNDSIKTIKKILHRIKNKETYLEEKLPVIRAEAAEIRKDQPKQFGKARYSTPLSIIDLQTPERLDASGGKLRTSFMSTNLLTDSFSQLQRANMIPAHGRGGKKAARREYKMKNARAAGVRLGETDVNEIIQKAQEKAKLQPHVPNPTKNKKRKYEEISKNEKKNASLYDDDGSYGDLNTYVYDDDDIWG